MASTSVEGVTTAVAATSEPDVVSTASAHGNGDSSVRGRGGKRVTKRPVSATAEGAASDAASSSTTDSAPRAKASRGRGKRLSGSAASGTPGKSVEHKSSEPVPLPEHMDPPSQDAYKADLAKLETKVKELTEKIDRLMAGLIPQKLDEISEARKAFGVLVEKKKIIRESKITFYDEAKKHEQLIDNATGSHNAAKSKLQNMKKELKFDSVAKLDAAIRDLEHKIQTSSMPLNAEKKCVDEVRRLKSQRDAVVTLEKEKAEFKDTPVDTKELKAAKKKANEAAYQFKQEEQKN